MKKSAKPSIMLGLFVFVIYAFLMLAYVGVKLECEKLTKDKVLAYEKLAQVKNWKVNLIAQDQALSSEERIVGIAQDELGMVRRTEPQLVVKVSKEKIEHIAEALKEKYE